MYLQCHLFMKTCSMKTCSPPATHKNQCMMTIALASKRLAKLNVDRMEFINGIN